MTGNSGTLTYPPEGLGAPKDRHPAPPSTSASRPGPRSSRPTTTSRWPRTSSTSAFPTAMKDQAPRVMNVDGGWVLGVDGQVVLVPEFTAVLTQYDPVSGSHTGDIDARLAAPRLGGHHQGAGFPELRSRPVRMARQGGPRALLPHLQRAHRGGAGAVGPPHLRRGADQLVGCRRGPPDARPS